MKTVLSLLTLAVALAFTVPARAQEQCKQQKTQEACEKASCQWDAATNKCKWPK